MSFEKFEKLLTKDEILIEMYNKTLRQKVLNAIKNNDVDYLKSEDTFVNSIILPSIMKTPKNSKQQIIWLTITKSNSSTVAQFTEAISKLSQLRITQEKAKYCFESTGRDKNDFTNIHCHYLCMKQIGVNKQNYLRRLEKNLKDIVFNINIQIYTADYYDDKIDYMNGKKDHDQYDKPEITEAFRKQYNLLPFY